MESQTESVLFLTDLQFKEKRETSLLELSQLVLWKEERYRNFGLKLSFLFVDLFVATNWIKLIMDELVKFSDVIKSIKL